MHCLSGRADVDTPLTLPRTTPTTSNSTYPYHPPLPPPPPPPYHPTHTSLHPYFLDYNQKIQTLLDLHQPPLSPPTSSTPTTTHPNTTYPYHHAMPSVVPTISLCNHSLPVMCQCHWHHNCHCCRLCTAVPMIGLKMQILYLAHTHAHIYTHTVHLQHVSVNPSQ